MKTNTPKICLVSNTAWSFTRFRMDILKSLIADGYEVLVLAPEDQYVDQLKSLGLKFIALKQMANKGMNPYSDLRLYLEFRQIYREERPDMVIQYTVKPNIYSTIAANGLSIPVIAVVTGLGYAFINGGMVARIVGLLYRFALNKAYQVWFLNADDQAMFIEKGLVERYKVKRIPGEGIDCHRRFNPALIPRKAISEASNALRFLFFGRLLYDKGVREYVEAAVRIKSQYPHVQFQLLGYLNVDNPAAVRKEELDRWIKEGTVDYLGDTDDVRPYISSADCVVLPSYREGMSTSLQESASMAKPLIATDIPGCRELIDDGQTGFLCQPKDADSLVVGMQRIIELTPADRLIMGRRGRDKMIREYSVDRVIAIYRQAVKEMLDDGKQ